MTRKLEEADVPANDMAWQNFIGHEDSRVPEVVAPDNHVIAEPSGQASSASPAPRAPTDAASSPNRGEALPIEPVSTHADRPARPKSR